MTDSHDSPFQRAAADRSRHPDSCADDADDEVAQALARYLERVEAGERPALGEFIDQYPHLRESLRECLESLRLVDDVAGQLAGRVTPSRIPQSHLALGDFQIEREIGRGGMGVVYEARQLSLDRRVALKVLPFAAMLDQQQLRRFKNEAHAAAMLHHPHIVPVFFVGCERGVHYYVMPLVEGRNLQEIVTSAAAARRGAGPSTQGSEFVPAVPHVAASDSTQAVAQLETALSSSARMRARHVAQLGIEAATALSYAHREGVIHRDIKPSNLLVDGSGKLWVTDFGLASVQGSDCRTLTGSVVGTLRYMSPEQLAGDCVVDQRTDVYSLGLTLYELLTLQPAFPATERPQLVRQIQELEPAAIRQLDPSAPVDLVTIIERAIHKDRDGRYRTAEDLADDLRRFLEQRPILARPVGRLERLWRWCQRSPAFAGLISAALLLSMSVTALSIALAARETSHNRAAQVRAQEAEWQQYVSDMHSAMAAWEQSNVGRTVELLERHRPRAGEQDLRGFEWDYLWRQCHDERRLVTIQEGARVRALAFSHDGRWLATGADTGLTRIWDASTGQLVREFRADKFLVVGVAFSENDTHLAAAGWEGLVTVCDLTTGELRQMGKVSTSITANMLLSSDATRVATDSRGELIKIWNFTTGQELAAFRPQTQHPLTLFTSLQPWDGRRMWIAGSDGTLRQWDIDANRELRSIQLSERPLANPWVCAVSSDSLRAAVSGPDGVIRLFDLETGGAPVCFGAKMTGVRSLAFAPDNRSLASSDNDGKIVEWNLETRQPARVLRGHAGPVTKLTYSDDGRRLASAGMENQVHIWDAVRQPTVTDELYGHPALVDCLNFSPDGRTLVSGGGGPTGGTVIVWDAATGQLKATLRGHSADVGYVSVSPDGQEIASAGDDGTMRLWNLADGAELATIHAADVFVSWVEYSHDGRELVSADRNGVISVWDRSTKKRVRTVQLGRPRAFRPALSPDGRSIVAHVDGELRILDYATLAIARRIPIAISGMSSAVFTRDGRMLAVNHGKRVYLIALDRGELIGTLEHSSETDIPDFSPDGRLLATCAANEIHVWDVEHRAERARLHGHDDVVEIVRFSPDGKAIASAGMDGIVRLWRSAPRD